LLLSRLQTLQTLLLRLLPCLLTLPPGLHRSLPSSICRRTTEIPWPVARLVSSLASRNPLLLCGSGEHGLVAQLHHRIERARLGMNRNLTR
jgi:hypothetical protein